VDAWREAGCGKTFGCRQRSHINTGGVHRGTLGLAEITSTRRPGEDLQTSAPRILTLRGTRRKETRVRSGWSSSGGLGLTFFQNNWPAKTYTKRSYLASLSKVRTTAPVLVKLVVVLLNVKCEGEEVPSRPETDHTVKFARKRARGP